MKELLEYIWNDPMWAILTAIGLLVAIFGAWFVYLFISINKTRDRNYKRMNADFENARQRVRSKLKV